MSCHKWLATNHQETVSHRLQRRLWTDRNVLSQGSPLRCTPARRQTRSSNSFAHRPQCIHAPTQSGLQQQQGSWPQLTQVGPRSYAKAFATRVVATEPRAIVAGRCRPAAIFAPSKRWRCCLRLCTEKCLRLPRTTDPNVEPIGDQFETRDVPPSHKSPTRALASRQSESFSFASRSAQRPRR